MQRTTTATAAPPVGTPPRDRTPASREPGTMGHHLTCRTGRLAALVAGAALAWAAPARADDEAPKGPTPQTDLINKHLAESWKANKITPSRKAGDAEFLRRVTLDILGRIATPEEAKFFFSDPRPNRRALLVHRLLYDSKFRLHADGRYAG